MHRLTKVWMALLVVVLIVSGLPAEAQTSKGTLAGVVRDASGAVIANADVTVINEATTETRQTKSNEQGEYRVDAISAGSYSTAILSISLCYRVSIATACGTALRRGRKSTGS